MAEPAPPIPLARRAAEAVLALGRPDAEVAGKVRTCLLDVIGAALESRDLPWGRQALRLAQPVPEGAAIIGAARRATPGDAAFANAVLGHGLVREDMHAGAISHLGVVVMPALLALAATRTISGARFAQAAVAGYEVGAAIGQALFTTELARLFRPTGITGPIGAAAAGAVLLGLDAAQTTSAIAMAANATGGLNEWPAKGGTEMFFHPGFAARNAVTAVLLAEAGAEAADSALDGPAGLFAAFRRETAPEIGFFQGRPRILEVYNKPVPACNFAQTACQVALRLHQAHAPAPEAIRAIRIRVPRAAARYPGCDATGPFDRLLQAKMSIPFGVAATLLQGRIAEENYRLPPSAALLRLIGLTQLEEDAVLTAAFPVRQGAAVTLLLADGEVSDALPDVVAATADQVRDRALQAAAAALGAARAAAIGRFVEALDAQPDMAVLGNLFAASEGPRA